MDQIEKPQQQIHQGDIQIGIQQYKYDNESQNQEQENNQQKQQQFQMQAFEITHNADDIKKSSIREAKINLFKGYLGSGILALPYSFSQTGYLLGLIIFIIIAFIVYKTMQLVIAVAESFKKENIGYPQLAEYLFGQKGVIAIKSILIIFQYGVCISYVIFFILFFEHAFSTAGNRADDFIYLILALCVVIPFSLINNFSLFIKISVVSNIFIIITLLAILFYEFYTIFTTDVLERTKYNIIHLEKTPMMIGVAIFAFEAVGIILGIKNSMKQPTQFTQVLRHTNMALVIIYIIFSVFGTLAFEKGNTMKEIILFSLPQDSQTVAFFQILYAFALALTYPLQLLPTFQILESTKFIKQRIDIKSKKGCIQKAMVRIFISICICSIAYAAPRFALFLNIVGAVAGTALQFVIPILMYNKVFNNSMSKNQKIQNNIYLSIGILGGMYSFIYSVYEFANPSNE